MKQFAFGCRRNGFVVHVFLNILNLWKPGAPCSKDVAKHTIYGEYFVIICALENVGLRTPLSRENMKIQNIINLYAYRSRMCSLEKFRGDVNSHDLLHNLNISSYTLLLRMSTNAHTRPHWQTGSHRFLSESFTAIHHSLIALGRPTTLSVLAGVQLVSFFQMRL